MVAHSWHRNWLEEILTGPREERLRTVPSPYISLPLMSIIKIARWAPFSPFLLKQFYALLSLLPWHVNFSSTRRECGWRSIDSHPTCQDTCVVCFESKCTVAAEGIYNFAEPPEQQKSRKDYASNLAELYHDWVVGMSSEVWWDQSDDSMAVGCPVCSGVCSFRNLRVWFAQFSSIIHQIQFNITWCRLQSRVLHKVCYVSMFDK